MNKLNLLLILPFFFFGFQGMATGSNQLKISKNKRSIEYSNGKPFFYLGDAAWELFHKLNREEATEYLKNRAWVQLVIPTEITPSGRCSKKGAIWLSLACSTGVNRWTDQVQEI